MYMTHIQISKDIDQEMRMKRIPKQLKKQHLKRVIKRLKQIGLNDKAQRYEGYLSTLN